MKLEKQHSNQAAGTRVLNTAAKEFARLIAASLVKRWQKELQAKAPDSGEIIYPSLRRP